MKKFWQTVLPIVLLAGFTIALAGCGAKHEAVKPQNTSAVSSSQKPSSAQQANTEPSQDNTQATEEINQSNEKDLAGKADKVNQTKASNSQPEPSKETQVTKGTTIQTTPVVKKGLSQATLWVSQDFAHSILLNKNVPATKDITVLDTVKENLKVDTAYGGGFINAINGLQSGYTGKLFGGKKMDWFYWVNGIMVGQGAGDYLPEPGDVIWWDYHDWGSGSFVSAVVGAYPQPFVNGYDGVNTGTVIAYTPGHQASADKIAQALRNEGTKNVTVQPLFKVSVDQRTKITIVTGLWSELSTDDFFTGLNDNNRKTGIYASFSKDGITALDYERNPVTTYKGGAGAIVATGRGLGDKNPLWLVLGVDNQGLDNAVNLLVNQSGELQKKVGVIVSGNKVQAIPVVK